MIYETLFKLGNLLMSALLKFPKFSLISYSTGSYCDLPVTDFVSRCLENRESKHINGPVPFPIALLRRGYKENVGQNLNSVH